jgi:hypothetical protein
MKATKQGNLRGQCVFLRTAMRMVFAAVLLLAPNGVVRGQVAVGLPADVEPIAASDIPRSVCNYYSVQRFWLPPTPDNWLSDRADVVLYVSPSWGTNVIFVGDQEIDYEALRLQRREAWVLRELAIQAGLASPEDLPPVTVDWEDDAKDSPPPLGPLTDCPAGSLLLAIAPPTNGLTPLRLTNTCQGVLYEVLSKVALTNGDWTSEKVLLGATNQNWTPTEVSVGERTNSLFFWALSRGTGDDHGVPWAWYEEDGLLPLVPDIGTGDADGDTLLNWQEYLWGGDPQAWEGFSVWVSSPAGYSGMP